MMTRLVDLSHNNIHIYQKNIARQKIAVYTVIWKRQIKFAYGSRFKALLKFGTVGRMKGEREVKRDVERRKREKEEERTRGRWKSTKEEGFGRGSRRRE